MLAVHQALLNEINCEIPIKTVQSIDELTSALTMTFVQGRVAKSRRPAFFGLSAQASQAPRKHLVDAMAVAKVKVQSIAPVYGASRDAVASTPKAGMVWNVPLFVCPDRPLLRPAP
jgi:hypothetical protein